MVATGGQIPPVALFKLSAQDYSSLYHCVPRYG